MRAVTRARLDLDQPDTVLQMTRAMYRTQKCVATHPVSELADLVDGKYLPDVPREVPVACFEEYRSTGRCPERPGHRFTEDFNQSIPMLRDPERFGYSPAARRPDFGWSCGKRLALYVAVNIEHFPWGEKLRPGRHRQAL